MSELGDITPCWTLTFERRVKQPPERVWAAISDPAVTSKWMRTHRIEIDLRVGGYWHAYHGHGDEPWLPGVIVRVETDRMLAYVWGYSVIEWRLEPDGAGCRYSFVVHGNPPPPDGADWNSEGVAVGWHDGVDSMHAYLEESSISAEQQSARGMQLAPYRERIDAVMKR